MVGYPGETKEKFKKLCQFIKEGYFDYAGFFAYSKEPNTASFYMKNHLSKFKKKSRLKKVLKIQEEIMTNKAAIIIGQEMQVLIDAFDEQTGEYLAHSQKLSPMVDFGVRFVDNGKVKVGDMVKVKIYDFDGSDFKGEIL